jgi:hypothetical protein
MKSQKRPPARKQQGPPAAPSTPVEAFVPENPLVGFVSGEQKAPQAKEESTTEGRANEDKSAEQPVGLPTDEPADAGSWYDDKDFLTLQRDENLANLPPARVTKTSLTQVVLEAKRLGKKANELNRTGAHQRHLAVIARWYEGDRLLAIHDFLVAQDRRPEWVPLYESAGLTAKQISRATRLRRAFPTVDDPDLKKIPTLEEADALATSILNNKKRNESGAPKDNTPDTGAGADSTIKAPKAHIKKRRKRRSKGTAGATLPPDPVEALEGEFKRQYGPDHLRDMGVQMIERGLGRAAEDEKPIRVDAVLDDLATVALAAADKKVQDIDKEDAEGQQSVRQSLKTIFDFVEGPARILDPTWRLVRYASWVSLATDESVRLKWDDPRTQCDVDKAIDSLAGSLDALKKRRAEGQQE